MFTTSKTELNIHFTEEIITLKVMQFLRIIPRPQSDNLLLQNFH